MLVFVTQPEETRKEEEKPVCPGASNCHLFRESRCWLVGQARPPGSGALCGFPSQHPWGSGAGKATYIICQRACVYCASPDLSDPMSYRLLLLPRQAQAGMGRGKGALPQESQPEASTPLSLPLCDLEQGV